MSVCQDLSLQNISTELRNLMSVKWNALGDIWADLVDSGTLESFLEESGDVLGDSVKNGMVRTMNSLQSKYLSGDVAGTDWATMLTFIFTGGAEMKHGLAAYILSLYKEEVKNRIIIGHIIHSDLLTLKMILNMVMNALFGDRKKEAYQEIVRAQEYIEKAYIELGSAVNKLENVGIYSNASIQATSTYLEQAERILNTPVLDVVMEEVQDATKSVDDYLRDITDAEAQANAIPDLTWSKEKWENILNEVIRVNARGQLDSASIETLKVLITQIAADLANYIPYNPARLFSAFQNLSSGFQSAMETASEQGPGWFFGLPEGAGSTITGAFSQRTLNSLNVSIKIRTQFIPDYNENWPQSNLFASAALFDLQASFKLLENLRTDVDEAVEAGPTQNSTILAAKKKIWKDAINNIQDRLKQSKQTFGDQLVQLQDADEDLSKVLEAIGDWRTQYNSDVPPPGERLLNRMMDLFGKVFSALTSRDGFEDFYNTVSEAALDARQMIDEDTKMLQLINFYLDSVNEIPTIVEARRLIENFIDSTENPAIKKYIKELQNGNLLVITNAVIASFTEAYSSLNSIFEGEGIQNPMVTEIKDLVGSAIDGTADCLEDLFSNDPPPFLAEPPRLNVDYKTEKFEAMKNYIDVTADNMKQQQVYLQGNYTPPLNSQDIESFQILLKENIEEPPTDQLYSETESIS